MNGYGAVNTELGLHVVLGDGLTSKHIIKNFSVFPDGDTMAIECAISLYVPMIVAESVEGHVSVQGCVSVTLAIQEHTAWTWPLVPT